MKLTSNALILFVLFISGCSERTAESKTSIGKEHSLLTELKIFTDISSLPEYLNHAYCAQEFSWDTTGGNDDSFNGTYFFLRKNKDGSLVLFDRKGSGVINRIWTPTPSEDTLNFYIDDEENPAFSISFINLFSGKYYRCGKKTFRM